MSAVADASEKRRLDEGWARLLFVLVASAGIAALKWWTLDMPANWDESWAVLPGAIELRDNGFNIPAMLDAGGYNQYGPATHGASPVTWLAGLVFTFVPADQALRALHFVHFLIGGLALAEIYRFVRGVWGSAASVVFAASMALVPVISAQLGAVYLELPLLAAAALAANAFIREKYWWAAGWAALATAVKPTGIYVAMAIALALFLGRKSWKSLLRGALYGAPSIAIALWHLLEITSDLEQVRTPLGSITSSIGTAASMPEFSLPLILSVLAFLAIRRGVSPELRVRLSIGIAMEVAFVTMFVIVPLVGLNDRLLPRYVVGVLPFAAFVAIASLRRVFGSRLTVVFSALMVVLMALNTNGALSTRRDVNNVVLQERTNAYADLLLLQRELLTIGLERPEPVMVTAANYWFRAQYPELGYVDTTPSKLVDLGNAAFDPDDAATYPESFIVFNSEDYENRTSQFVERIEDDPQFETNTIERTRGRYTLELLIVRRVGT